MLIVTTPPTTYRIASNSQKYIPHGSHLLYTNQFYIEIAFREPRISPRFGEKCLVGMVRSEPYTKIVELPEMRREMVQLGRQDVRASRYAYGLVNNSERTHSLEGP